MAIDLRSAVMRALSSKLSISVSDLSKTLSVSPEELGPVLEALEREELIHRMSDSVTGDVLLSPTSRGILAARKFASFA